MGLQAAKMPHVLVPIATHGVFICNGCRRPPHVGRHRYWLVGFPHIYSLVQVRGTRLLCSFGGQSVELDSAYSHPVV